MLAPAGLQAKSYYYLENFPNDLSAQTNGWSYNFRMSRDMMVYDLYNDGATGVYNNHTGTVSASTGRLEIYGRPNNEALSWNNWYVGDGAKWDPAGCNSIGTSLTASAEEPFGYTLIRYVTSIDSSCEGQTSTSEMKSYISAWVAEDNGASNPYERFANFAYFYDKRVASDSYSTYGYFKDYEHDIAIANLTSDVDGSAVSSANMTSYFRKQYDDTSGTWHNTTTAHFGDGSNYRRPVYAPLGIKVTHDGTKVAFYVNPDPWGTNTGLPDTWIKIGESSVGWSDNLIAYLGSETCYYLTEDVESQFDNFCVRTVASNIVASITPQKAIANKSVTFTVSVTPQNVSVDDSGIGEIYIAKPTGYGSWTASGVIVSNTNGTKLTTVTTGAPTASQALVTTTSDGLLHVRFCMTSSAAGQNYIVRGGTVSVTFTLTTPSTANRDGDNFAVYGDCSQHANSAKDYVIDTSTGLRYATTGMKKARALSTGSLLVQVYTQPDAYAKVEYSPSPLTIGNEEADFTVKIGTPSIGNGPDISRIRIQIPAGFTVSNNSAGTANIVSSLLGSARSAGQISVSNGGSLKFIVVYYTNLSAGLSGLDGYDKISFKVYGTPTFSGKYYSNYIWQVAANSYDFVSGSVWTNAKTNSVYSSQISKVTVSNAQLLCSIYPEKTAIFSQVISNTNWFAYSLNNAGPAGNYVYKVKITVPEEFVGVTVISNLLGHHSVLSYTNATHTIYLNYSGFALTNGKQDKIFIQMAHTNTNVNSAPLAVDFICQADNNNTAGFKTMNQDSPKTWSVTITPPVPAAQNYISPRMIYTTAVTNTITNYIYNTASRGVSSRLGRIQMLTNYFPNIVSATSLRLTNQGNISFTTSGASNVILIHYDADTNGGLHSIYDDPGSPDKDVVLIKLVDALSYDTFGTYPTNVAMPTYLFKTTTESSLPDDYALATAYVSGNPFTNKLYVELPLLDVSFHLSPSVIDSTSNATAMTYVFTNNGLPGNRIRAMSIPFSTNITTSIPSVGVTNYFTNAVCSVASAGFNSSANSIDITYNPPLDGGQVSVVKFYMIDKVDGRDDTEFLTPDIQIDRGWYDNVTTGSYTLSFEVPKPTGGGWASPNVFYSPYYETAGTVLTQQFVLNVTNLGKGTDQFRAVSIVIPAPLRGQIGHVWSDRLGETESSANVDILLTNLMLVYSNVSKNILSGQGDKLTVTAYITNRHALPYGGNWLYYANNGFHDVTTHFFKLTNAVAGSPNLCGTERVGVYISTNSYTTETSASFHLAVSNGGTGSMSVDKIKIQIPWPFVVSNATKIQVIGGTAIQSKFISNNNFIWITYPSSGYLNADGYTVFNIDANKPVSSPMDTEWNTWVYYLSNYQSISNDTKGDKAMEIKPVSPTFYAYTSPNLIGKDEVSAIITMVVSNASEYGNNIYRLQITPPTTNSDPKLVITNIPTAQIHSALGGVTWYSNDGRVYVDYRQASTNLAYNASDVITMLVYDNQDNDGFQASWSVKAANITNADPSFAGQPLDDTSYSALYKVIIPNYSSSYSVWPSTLSTANYSNTIKVYLQNNSGTGTNNINKVRIYLPSPFSTTGLLFSTTMSRVSNYIGIENGTNYLQIYYLTNKFVPGTNDAVTIILKDTIDFGDTNVSIRVRANYSSSGTTFVSANLSGGNTIAFKMPNPSMSMRLLTPDIYTSQAGREAKVKFRFVNTGTGSNNAQKIYFYVPGGILTGLDLTDMSNTFATNVSFASNMFVMNYDGFVPKVTNDFYLTIVSTNKVYGTSLQFNASVFNGQNWTNLAVTSLAVIKAPSAKLNTKTVYSTPLLNTVSLNINNDITGTSSIYYANILLPSVFTNVSTVNSVYGQVVSNFNTNVVIYYPSGLAKGATPDTVTFSLMDNTNMFNTNGLKWVVELNNGTGYGTNRLINASDMSMSMLIPTAEATNNLITSWYIIHQDDNLTNMFILVISNRSADANLIYSNRIVLNSKYFSDVLDPATLQDSYAGSTITYTAPNIIDIVYDGTGALASGETNLVKFDFANNVAEPAYPVNGAEVYSYNDCLTGPYSETCVMSFNQPEDSTVAYVYDKQIIYSIDHTETIRYDVVNGRSTTTINKLIIAFDNTQLKITGIWSSNRGVPLTYTAGSLSSIPATGYYYTTNSNRLIVAYGSTSGGIGGKATESLMIGVAYNNSHNWTNDMSSSVVYASSVQEFSAAAGAGEVNYLPVLMADFGRIRGRIVPGFSSPTVYLYEPGTSTIVDNPAHDIVQLTVDCDTNGDFLLDFVPAGTFDVAFNGDGYFERVISNYTVTSNQIYNIATNRMKRQYFLSAGSYQTSVCLDDMQSQAILSSGSILPKQFSVNVWVSNMTPDQSAFASSGGVIVAPSDNTSVKTYFFNLEEYVLDQDKKPVTVTEYDEEALNGDMVITLKYDDADVTHKGWTEDHIAVYYWREMSKEWVRIGGIVDKDANTITIRSSYVHRYYAIFGETAVNEIAPGFVSVVTDPKVFTPGSSDAQYGNMKLTVSFSETVDSYTVTIYNIYGSVIKMYERSDATYSQGEVYWDGTDTDGVAVKTGVYVYRIIAGGHSFAGTIILAR